MDHYPSDDVLGQTVTEAREATRNAAEVLGALGLQLDAEREGHRAETLRLVERAEAAELSAHAWQERADAATDAGVRDAQASEKRERELERKLATAEERAAGWDSAAALAQERVAQLEAELDRSRVAADQRLHQLGQALGARDALKARVAQLEDQVVGYQQSLAQERDARRDAEDQRDDAERAQRLAEDRVAELERRLAVANQAAGCIRY